MVDIVDLLVEDAIDIALGLSLAPQWGIYLNGSPVIQPASIYGNVNAPSLSPIAALAGLVGAPNILPVVASTIEFEYAQDFPLSTYPQENGAFQTYDKVTLPWDVKLKIACGGSTSNRQAFLSTVQAIANSFALFDIVTPEQTYTGCNVERISWSRRSDRGLTLIVVEIAFKQIPITSGATFTNTQQPGDQSSQALGNVQPQSVASSASGGSFVGFLPQ